MNPDHLSRREFLQRTATLAIASRLPSIVQAQPHQGIREFRSDWNRSPDRIWLGAEYWANPLQDWRIADGWIECVHAALDRNVHILTHDLGDDPGDFAMSVFLGRVGGGSFGHGRGSAGFRVGITGELRDYRHNLIFGRGLDAGIAADGTLFIGNRNDPASLKISVESEVLELRLSATPAGGDYTVNLAAFESAGRELGVVTTKVGAGQLSGNLALVSNFDAPSGSGIGPQEATQSGGDPDTGKFRFGKWRLAGSKVRSHPDRAFGPILFSHYTLSRGILKMTAQMPPIGPRDSQTVRLQVIKNGSWTTLGEEEIHGEARTATFRVERWDASRDQPYRLAYALTSTDGNAVDHFWTGTVRRDPADQPVLTVADVSCNIHAAFPNGPYVANMANLNPDLLAFVGDQFYERSGGFGFIREPLDLAIVDYLRKWYLHGWTWRELMRNRPSVSLPDDHDVYQGNIWGEGGRGRTTTQEAGGYDMPATWVNVVHRSQTAHHPDAHDPTPGKRGTSNWYGELVYGGVSFAILADRQYKSGPEGKAPPTDTARGDHVMDPDFDPKTADVPGLDLLGAEQERFLRQWVRDWRGAEMKAVISQTLFTALPTTHGGGRMVLRADYDSNGWPQTPRNRAIHEMRKAFAFHLAGDQHLPAVVQYGVDEHRDGPVAFAGPAVNTGYPRWWEPQTAPWTNPTGTGFTGDFTDSFGHPMTVLAVRNGAVSPENTGVMRFLDEKASGLGIVRFYKRDRTIMIECWPFLADPTQPGTQFPGWPVIVNSLDNYARREIARLPTLNIHGISRPVIEVFDERGGELVYILRLREPSFQPHVFAAGRYTVRVSEPETGREKTIAGLEAKPGNTANLDVPV